MASGEVSRPRSLADCFNRLAKARTWTVHWAVSCMAPHDLQLKYTGQVFVTTQPSREHPDSLAALVYDRAQDEHRCELTINNVSFRRRIHLSLERCTVARVFEHAVSKPCFLFEGHLRPDLGLRQLPRAPVPLHQPLKLHQALMHCQCRARLR